MKSAAMTLVRGLALAAAARAATPSPLTGRWVMQGSRTILAFQPCGEATCGVLEASGRLTADPDARDDRNPDPQLRGRRLKGLTTLQALRPDGEGVWKGRVYVNGVGATYAVTVRRVDADTLTAKGCAAPLLCQTSTLKRLP